VEALRNVGTITGALIIRGSVEDLSPLRCLTNGPLELRIVETDRLTSLRGLEGIRSLDGNPGALERNLVIQANSVLTNLDGLSGLTRVGGDITLRDNDALVDVSGLGSLSDLGGGLSIVSNPKLEHIVGLESITRATDVTIMTNDALATIEGLGGLQEVGSLRIDLNPLLESVNGLESLVWVEDALYLWDNPIVTTLAPLANLTTARRLLLNRMHGLESLAGLENAGIQYEVNIQRNEGLVTTRGLRLAPAGVRPLEIQVRDNPRLTSLEGFSGVAGTIALFHVEANEALETLQGLEGIASATSIMVSSNPALRTLEGLDGLTTVTDSVTITSNESLTSLEALDSLSAGSLVVFANPALTSLSGLESLRSAVILNIGDNATLRSLRALAGVEAVERFTVWSNVLLPTCEAYWLRDTIGVENIGYWTISGNDDAGTCP
jgi:hypothetical protein